MTVTPTDTTPRDNRGAPRSEYDAAWTEFLQGNAKCAALHDEGSAPNLYAAMKRRADNAGGTVKVSQRNGIVYLEKEGKSK